MMTKADIIKLIAAILVIFFLSYGALLAGRSGNPTEKYQHPITRSGASW